MPAKYYPISMVKIGCITTVQQAPALPQLSSIKDRTSPQGTSDVYKVKYFVNHFKYIEDKL